jgi:polyisoprenoid-binding protein YceI
MKKNLLLSIALFISFSISAQSWKLDKAHAKLGFTVTHLLVSDVEGKFKNFDVNVTSAKDDFTDAVITLSADINSINTDNDSRDNDLKSEKFFDAKQFPTLSFSSTSIKKADTKNYKLYGNLTMHGVTKPAVLDVILNGIIQNPMNKKSVAGFKIKGTLKRSDFEIANSFPKAVVSDEVLIDANIELNK